MQEIDAVVLAAGRLSKADAKGAGHELKGLVRIGAVTPLRAMLGALRSSGCVSDVILVGPTAVRDAGDGFDRWLEEGRSGEDNALAGLRAARTRRVLLCASDVPFVRAEDVFGFLERVPHDAAMAYPVFERAEFLACFPDGREKFARLGGRLWTGGSVCLVERDMALENEPLIRRAFQARRSQAAMASLFGPVVLAKHFLGTLRVEDVVDRVGQLLGGKAVAVRGAHPRLAMDCDSIDDIEYARSLADGTADA